MASHRSCYVYVVLPGDAEFTTAGRFRLRCGPGGAASGEFVYGRSYLERSEAVELDPVELRLADRLYLTGRMGGFFGAVRDSMPDYWGRLLIERRLGRARLDEFEYLMEGPDDRAGALGFGPSVEPPSPRLRFAAPVALTALQAAADALAAGEGGGRAAGPGAAGECRAGASSDLGKPGSDRTATSGRHWWAERRQADHGNSDSDRAAALAHAIFDEGTSMGGARPKAVVEDGDALWLAKFSRPQDRWNEPRAEHAMLLLARECGIRAAESRIERAGNQDVLLVRRFDRERSGEEGGWLRHRMASALTLLRSDDSPTGRERWSYLALADELRRVSAQPTEDLKDLFARMCFNAAVSNLDDHPRNHAILARGRSWRLAPAYDLNPSPAYSMERDLSMVCGPEGRRARRENLVAGAARFLMGREEAEAALDRIVAVVRARWREAATRAGVGAGDREALRSAFVPQGLFFESTS